MFVFNYVKVSNYDGGDDHHQRYTSKSVNDKCMNNNDVMLIVII